MTDFPVIAEWERNAREVARVSLDCYRGQYTIDVRVWWFSGKDLKPSKSGITLSVKHSANLAAALANADSRARELQLTGVADDR